MLAGFGSLPDARLAVDLAVHGPQVSEGEFRITGGTDSFPHGCALSLKFILPEIKIERFPKNENPKRATIAAMFRTA
jgi:hypothetical protein